MKTVQKCLKWGKVNFNGVWFRPKILQKHYLRRVANGTIKGITLVIDYCDGCASILDGIAKEQKLRQKCNCLGQGNFD